MIRTTGQYVFRFSLSGYEDFIDEGNISNFVIIEEAGNVLPTFQLLFKSNDETMTKLINEGVEIQLQFGKENPDLQAVLTPTKIKLGRVGDGYREVNIIGLYSAKKYIIEPRLRISSSVSGVEAISTVVNTYFRTNFNITSSSDSQKWIQYNITDKKFVNDIWLHSYIPNSFILIGITSDGAFILKDMRTIVQNYLSSGPDWKFTANVVDDKDIPYSGDYTIENNTGFLNYFAGYGKTKLKYNFELGTSESIIPEAFKYLVSSNNLNRSNDIGSRFTGIVGNSDNVHSYYQLAMLNNITNLAILSSLKVIVSFTNVFKTIKILDLVMLKDAAIGTNTVQRSSETTSGLYIITKVSRQLQGRRFMTTVEMCREGLNELIGDLR